MRSIPFLAALFSIASLIVSPTHAMGRPLSNHKRYTADQIPTQEAILADLRAAVANNQRDPAIMSAYNNYLKATGHADLLAKMRNQETFVQNIKRRQQSSVEDSLDDEEDWATSSEPTVSRVVHPKHGKLTKVVHPTHTEIHHEKKGLIFTKVGKGHMVVQHPKHGAIIVKIGGNVAAKSYDDDEFTSDDGYNYDD